MIESLCLMNSKDMQEIVRATLRGKKLMKTVDPQYIFCDECSLSDEGGLVKSLWVFSFRKGANLM